MMKICLLQCNVINGDLPRNAAQIFSLCSLARERGAELCLVPVEALCGPQIRGYENQRDFIKACGDAAQWLATQLNGGPALLCGLPDGALFIQGGCCAHVARELFFGGHTFIIDSVLALDSAPGDAIIAHMKAWSFSPAGQEKMERVIAEKSFAWGAPVLAVNLWGGYGGCIYSGQSFATDGSGRICARAKPFVDDLLLLDTDSGAGQLSPLPDADEAEWLALVTGTRDFALKSGSSTVALGLSGGMDSALVACIAAEALGAENVTGILMPSPFSSDSSIDDAQKLAANLGIAALAIPIDPAMETFENMLEPVFELWPERPGDLTLENLQARLRGVILMAFANHSGALILNTGNKSEAAMGYSTLYGDSVGAIAVLGDVLKTRVYQLARWYCAKKGSQIIPQNIFDKEPSAELRPNQKDSDSLPPYEVLDPMLAQLLTAAEMQDAAKLEEFETIRRRVFGFQFKRAQTPAPLLVSGAPMAHYPLTGNYNTKI